MGDLPGILPPDAGRLERAARRYAIAVLSDRTVDDDDALGRAVSAMDCCYSLALVCNAVEVSITHDLGAARARVALYLRWCERVERSWSTIPPIARFPSDASWWASGHRVAHGADGEPMLVTVWAVPLWTLAPTHDPAVTAAERRKRKRSATMEAP